MRYVYGFGAVAALAVSASGQLTLLNTFDPVDGGAINSIGFSRGTDEVFVHFNHSASVHVYSRAGVLLRTIAKPGGVAGNDDDLEFTDVAVNVGGVQVPANSLLVLENDYNPPRVFAGRASDGLLLAEQSFDSSQTGYWVGGGYHPTRHTFFIASWQADLVQEVNVGTGAVLNTFGMTPAGSPAFDIYYGDMDVLGADGLLYVVGSVQDVIRVLSPSGAWVQDMDVTPMNIYGMAGLAFDDGRGEAWICSQNGSVYQVGGFGISQGCNAADFASPWYTLNFFDVQAFLQAFSAHASSADMNSDGMHNFFDVQTFLSMFSAGCP